MTKDAVFTMKLEPDLRDAFMAVAAARHLSASHLVREFMRDVVKRAGEASEYDEWLRQKVELARMDIDAGRTFSNDEIDAEAAEWRAKLLRRSGEAAG